VEGGGVGAGGDESRDVVAGGLTAQPTSAATHSEVHIHWRITPSGEAVILTFLAGRFTEAD